MDRDQLNIKAMQVQMLAAILKEGYPYVKLGNAAAQEAVATAWKKLQQMAEEV